MKYYKNPIKKQGDFADPFVQRYNGRYYLYCTNPDIRCWSSKDLLNWDFEGPVIGPDEFPGLVPFAPEVIYWNGYFYMYTSPHGFGHFVLKSNSPTGPFRKISDNVAHSIDGSIFIDDDGQWYFYWADDSGILGCTMKSPIEFGEPVNTGAFLQGWTEGPFVLKQNGKYYMTYTGNHYLSSGYRINAAFSNHPLSGYKDDPYNPIVLHTEGSNIGLGHSSTVLGPDLKSFYMVYHNFNPDVSRDLNIDFQCWHGISTQIYGPTRSRQPAPKQPDFSDYAEDDAVEQWHFIKGTWHCKDLVHQVTGEEFCCLTENTIENTGVIEANLKATGNPGRYGVIFGWRDPKDYYMVSLSYKEKIIQLIRSENGEEYCITQSMLPDDFDENALHCHRLICSGRSVVIYIDNRKQMEAEIQTMEGKFGYFASKGNIAIGFSGFSNGTVSEEEKELYKPVPGVLFASTSIGDSFDESLEGTISLYAGQQLLYHLNIEASGIYTAKMYGRFFSDTAWLISADGKCIEEKSYPVKESGILSFDIELPEGLHAIGLLLQKGKTDLERIEFFPTMQVPHEEKRTIEKFGPYGKQIWGEDGWSNYFIKAYLKVEPEAETAQGGILFRVCEPSEGGEGNDPVLGTNFFKGYFVGISGTYITLSKHSYNEVILSRRKCFIGDGELHKISIDVSDDTFQIFVDECDIPILVFHDEVPFTHGRIGVRTQNATLEGMVIINRHENLER